MATISIDLAYKDYADIGVVTVSRVGSRVLVTPVNLPNAGLQGTPSQTTLAEALIEIANSINASWMLIDGPQAWKCPSTGEPHARKCERELATQGKTGLPGMTKPANYLGFISFSIELFSALAVRGWPRLLNREPPVSSSRAAIESFPTAAWRSLGLRPLPGKSKSRSADIRGKLGELRSLFPLDVPDDLTHDELQALIAGLAGLALDAGNRAGFSLAGISPYLVEGTWREGFIMSPTRNAAG